MPEQQRHAMVLMHAGAFQITTDEEGIAQFREHLSTRGIDADVRMITEETTAKMLVTEAVDSHYDLIIAAGGDGTVQQVAAHMRDRTIPFGILPLGTMNNIAFSLGLPMDLDSACDLIAYGTPKQIDMGVLNGVPYLEVANIGAEAEMSPLIEALRHKGFLSTLGATATFIKQIMRLHSHVLTIEVDGRRKHIHAWEVTVCNTPYYGLRYPAAHGARIDDGLLDVIIIRHRGILGYMGHYWAMLRNHDEPSRNVRSLRAQHVTITTKDPMPIAIGGYTEGMTPATVEVAAGALKVYAPDDFATTKPTGGPLTYILRSVAPISSPSH